eukprot:TRINITY_DN42639_c0_g1_i1.p1 TRINITY_DN42639_c0_g1~~TRINITY_DN42639_c0_g1_i1.p1  ORF type:complete len:168 (+),score=18.59 TRINITY_DN42639_c0_g1_i1:68-571(+)
MSEGFSPAHHRRRLPGDESHLMVDRSLRLIDVTSQRADYRPALPPVQRRAPIAIPQRFAGMGKRTEGMPESYVTTNELAFEQRRTLATGLTAPGIPTLREQRLVKAKRELWEVERQEPSLRSCRELCPSDVGWNVQTATKPERLDLQRRRYFQSNRHGILQDGLSQP